jgi:hypothetical protein
MMRRLKFLLPAVLTAATGFVPAVVARADSSARPFTGTLVGEVDFIGPAPGCPINLITTSDAGGTFSHLGRTTMHSEHCTPLTDLIPFGEMTLTAANGDKVFVEYNALAPFPTPDTTVIHLTGDIKIVGGTGRFAGATGGQFDTDWNTFNYTAAIQFPGFGPGGQPLPGPWPAVWRFGPTTIGY